MGLSNGEHDFEEREIVMEIQQHHQYHAVEFDVEFWPLEHPMEPQDEDRPVKCPIPASSSIINDGRAREESYSESLRKRAEIRTIVNKQGIVIVDAESPPFEAVRKKHHALAEGDRIVTRTSTSLPPLPSQNLTIFHMLQQLDEYGC
ncbi:uncharacterized protein LOC126682011 [Mercurialis annua]|uniref:uncharacterized protein LOC126682011 n=1 Tax=Mercurialis annua TaxID=3986 RepID=UPI0024AD4069|nr:uncharacterized protein LOC126682011 [Mercurialis annua]